VAVGGRVGVVGIRAAPVEVPFAQLLFKNVTVRTGLGDLRHMNELLALIASGRLDPSPMVTSTRPFAEVEQAFHDMEQRAPGVKTLVTHTPLGAPARHRGRRRAYDARSSPGHVVGRPRSTQQEALALVAPEESEGLELRGPLDSLRHRGGTEGVRELDNGQDKC